MTTYNPGSAFTETSPYGPRILNGRPDFHPGIDFAAPVGTGIPAASTGVVWYSGYNSSGYGNTVVIKSVGADGQSYYTLYAHMNGVGMPTVGQTVNEGDAIGQVGMTGSTTGPHVHFEVLDGDAPISNTAGGPIGVKSSDTSVRTDPSAFDDWANSDQPFGAGTPAKLGNGGKGGPEDVADPVTGNDDQSSEVISGSNDTSTVYLSDGSEWLDNKTTNADNSVSEDFKDINSSDNTEYEQITNTSSSGIVNASISGQGDVASLTDATITLAANAQATVGGTGNIVTLTSNDSVIDNGANTIDRSVNGSNYTIVGAASASTDTSGDMTLAGPTINGTNAVVLIPASGSGAQLQIGNGTTISIPTSSGSGATTVGFGGDGSDGGYTVTTQAPNSVAAAYVSQTIIYNNNGQGIGSVTQNKDGTLTMNDTDPASGTVIVATTDNSQAQPIRQSFNPNATYDQVVSGAAQALAAELISQVLIKNQVVGAAAQAFVDAAL